MATPMVIDLDTDHQPMSFKDAGYDDGHNGIDQRPSRAWSKQQRIEYLQGWARGNLDRLADRPRDRTREYCVTCVLCPEHRP